MARLVLFYSVFFSVIISQVVKLDACGDFGTINLNVNDDATEIAWSGPETGIVEDIQLIPVEPTHQDVIQPTYADNKFGLTPGVKFADFLDITARAEAFVANLKYTCDGQPIDESVFILFVDQNNRPPLFNVPELSFTIPSSWDRNIPLNWNYETSRLITSDADFSETNAALTLTSDPDILTFQMSPQWDSGVTPSPSYDTEIHVYLKEDASIPSGTTSIVVTATDGKNPTTATIRLEIQLLDNIYPPEFTEISYLEKLDTWPKLDQPLTVPIKATDPDDPNVTPIIYTLTSAEDFDFLTLTNNNPLEIVFKKDIQPGDLPPVTIFEIQATEDLPNGPLSSSVSLILQFPELKSNLRFQKDLYEIQSDWIVVAENDVVEVGFLATGEANDDIKYEILDNVHNIQILDDGNIQFVQDVTEDNPPLPNNVLYISLRAFVDTDSSRGAGATIAVMFPNSQDRVTFLENRYQSTLTDWPSEGEEIANIVFRASSNSAEDIDFKLENQPSFLEISSSTGKLIFSSEPPVDFELGPNKILIFDVIASVQGKPEVTASVPVILLFPNDGPSTTDPSTTTCDPCTTEEPVPCTTITPTTPDPSTCAPCTTVDPEPCPSTPDPSTGTCAPCTTEAPEPCPSTPDPSTGTCAPCTTEAPEPCPSTPDPSTGTCAPCTTVDPEPCPTTGAPCAECPSTPDPSTGTCAPCTTEAPEPCPSTPDPSTGTCAPCTTEAPEPCPSTPDPSTGTCAPCTTEAPEPCTTIASTTCAPCTECPSTPDPSTGTCAPCNTAAPEPCTTIASSTCAPCTECPITPDPSTGTCAPCTTISPEPCTTISPTTCAPCTECPITPAPSTADSSSNTGLIAGIVVVSIIAVGSIGAAGYLFWKLRKVPSNSLTSGRKISVERPTRKSFSNGRNMRASFVEPETGLGRSNLGFVNSQVELPPSSGGHLQEVLSHPVAQPIGPSSTEMASATTPALKSAIAVPKEIDPDYDEGVNKSGDKAPAKARTGGVKIADEVEIIDDNNDQDPDSDSDQERL